MPLLMHTPFLPRASGKIWLKVLAGGALTGGIAGAAMLLMMGFSTISVCTCMFMKTVLRRENKRMVEEAIGTGRTVNLHTL